MLPDLGNLCLYISLSIACTIALGPLLERYGLCFGYRTYKLLWISVFCLVLCAFFILIYSYAISDFSLVNVVNNSHTKKPLIYKISGAWGNHEGSMLLWISSINFFTMIFCCFKIDDKLGKFTLSIQSIFNIFFIAFTLFICSPFRRIFPPPSNGFGLNPILQDIGLAMHPPVLYLGYVGFSIVYSMTIAALILKKIDQHWAEIVKICSLISISFLTIGIALGSWWAYRELGWGGFWFWDPVENASIMPWLSSIALIHAINIYKKTNNLKQWSILLSLLTFTLSMIGMFLVRSGIVTSVHAFATDASRGVYILSFLSTILISSACIYISQYKAENKTMKLFSRELFITLNNIFILITIITIAIGTLYPMILEIISGIKISVGAPYFNKVFNPIIIFLACACAISSGLFLKKHTILYRNITSFFISFIITALIAYYFNVTHILAILGLISGIWLMLSTIALYIKNFIASSIIHLNMILGHMGLAIIIIAISLNAGLSKQAQMMLRIGASHSFQEYSITLMNVYYEKQHNYIAQIADVEIERNGMTISLKPEIRFFEIEKQQTIESAIYKNVFYDLYVVTDQLYSDEDGIMISLYYKPMMSWLWFGAILIALSCIRSTITAIANRIKK